MGKDKTLNQEVAEGAFWMVSARLVVKGLGLISIIILARLLIPDDFGIIALASSIYAMIELMRSMGFDTVLIQKQQAGREQYDTAWTLQIIFSSFAACVMLLIAPLMASFYEDQRLIQVLWVMAGMTFLNGLTNIGVVEFRKQMNFNKDFAFQVLVKLSGFLVTIPLAFYWRSYWAMVAGMVSTRLVTVLLSYYMQEYRPRLSLSAFKEIMGFSSWLFVNNILKFANSNSQNFIIGKMNGANGLGGVSVATQISTLISTELIGPINRAAYPGYAKNSSNQLELKKLYLKIISHIAILSSFFGFVILVTAPYFVPALLGDKWMNIIELIQILSFSSILVSFNSNAGYIYLVLGVPKISTYIILFRVSLIIPLIYYFSSNYGILGVAYAEMITSLIMFPISQLITLKFLNIKVSEMLNVIYRPFFSGIVTVLILNSYPIRILHLENQFLLLIMISFFSVLVFMGCLLVLWIVFGKGETAEIELYNKVISRIKKNRV